MNFKPGDIAKSILGSVVEIEAISLDMALVHHVRYPKIQFYTRLEDLEQIKTNARYAKYTAENS
jgi:hypothetical protein